MNFLFEIISIGILGLLWFFSDRYIRLLSKKMNDAATNHNKRISKTKLDFNDYLNNNKHIKNKNWLKQQDIGKISSSC